MNPATRQIPGGGLKSGKGFRPPLTRLDAVLLVFLAGCAGYVAWRVTAQNAKPWEWVVLGQYLVRADGGPGLLLQGLLTTLRLTCWSAVIALFLGVWAGLARTSPSLYLRLVGSTYVELCRNLPPLVLIFLCYFFLADQIAPAIGLQDALRTAPDSVKAVAGVLIGRLDQVDAFVTAAFTLGLYEGAYVAEIVRGGIRSVDAGQWEAGRAQGFPRFGLMVFIIMPQAVRNMIPPLAGQIISTIKDSAIVSVISIQELTFQGMQLMATTYLTMEVWTCVALLYFVLTFSCSMGAARLEHRLRRRYTV
ncbi:amino acid ABC transporter permease [Desulfomicrobium sp. ZS1]|uniref:amino acid ABC transporter permease n=1 Tax=Desulfomicrobium sp. ZS1 TaxID=2952228 RepID=UPI0020B24D92|nr:amino acid ABC transporter permease [Desulfomicrobium sp. ZS1]UTF49456.1 amino acid ABC transporter permease [Desulfomicrobium sp. ZS1]